MYVAREGQQSGRRRRRIRSKFVPGSASSLNVFGMYLGLKSSRVLIVGVDEDHVRLVCGVGRRDPLGPRVVPLLRRARRLRVGTASAGARRHGDDPEEAAGRSRGQPSSALGDGPRPPGCVGSRLRERPRRDLASRPHALIAAATRRAVIQTEGSIRHGTIDHFEEALELGGLTDHDDIGDLVERAWEVRTENFGDSTDMCSLVNAKSGGCAEDCGFCAQSRYAEADTPMHAMMEPEQILEHAKRGRGRRRPPLLHGHPGPGPLQARLREDPRGRQARRRADQPEALRLGRPHLPRPGQSARRGRHPARPPQRRDGALLLRRGHDHGPVRGPDPDDRRGPRGRPGDLRRRHPQPRRVARASGSRWPSSWPRSTRPRCRSTCSTRAPAPSSATAT